MYVYEILTVFHEGNVWHILQCRTRLPKAQEDPAMSPVGEWGCGEARSFSHWAFRRFHARTWPICEQATIPICKVCNYVSTAVKLACGAKYSNAPSTPDFCRIFVEWAQILHRSLKLLVQKFNITHNIFIVWFLLFEYGQLFQYFTLYHRHAVFFSYLESKFKFYTNFQ